ncbi:hypothetical protein M422DRAFT_263542 [Sphaerobolus stellatus SS14]|uniref:Unplaced genomic scaffold SPHSTscaffold_125, whole genome shotgun sequence n=1 Tax=Sphaerobolus stellatus (strain SS14) TaxID=990650 RepID=A0A0C9VAD4_SPHS4|nr:hypothetical protein M422DRAFT_263542 [Sphaerobolus stellatus SS14]
MVHDQVPTPASAMNSTSSSAVVCLVGPILPSLPALVPRVLSSSFPSPCSAAAAAYEPCRSPSQRPGATPRLSTPIPPQSDAGKPQSLPALLHCVLFTSSVALRCTAALCVSRCSPSQCRGSAPSLSVPIRPRTTLGGFRTSQHCFAVSSPPPPFAALRRRRLQAPPFTISIPWRHPTPLHANSTPALLHRVLFTSSVALTLTSAFPRYLCSCCMVPLPVANWLMVTQQALIASTLSLRSLESAPWPDETTSVCNLHSTLRLTSKPANEPTLPQQVSSSRHFPTIPSKIGYSVSIQTFDLDEYKFGASDKNLAGYRLIIRRSADILG